MIFLKYVLAIPIGVLALAFGGISVFGFIACALNNFRAVFVINGVTHEGWVVVIGYIIGLIIGIALGYAFYLVINFKKLQ